MSITPEQAASRFEIGDLVSGLALALDDRDFVRLRGIFAEDIVWVLGRGKDNLQGADVVVDYLRSVMGPMGISVHRPAAPVVNFETHDAAAGEVAASVIMAAGGTTIALEVRYQDRYVRRDGEWKLAKRTPSTLYALPLAELAGLLPQTALRSSRSSAPGGTPPGEAR